MKKLLSLIILVTVSMGLFAQSESEVLKSKKGVPIKPAAGDFAIGIDATPFFRYAGNMFSGNNPYFPSFGFTAQNPGAIFVKFKASNSMTYRGSVLLGYTTETEKDANFTDPDQIDKLTTTALSVGLTGGVEFHRDIFGRLSGYYGGQAGVMKDPYYSAVGAYYGKASYKDANDSSNDYKETGGNTYSALAGAFVGIEFFIAPRIALSGEFGYYVTFYTEGKRIGKPASGAETTLSYGGSGTELQPMNSGNLMLLFYF